MEWPCTSGIAKVEGIMGKISPLLGGTLPHMLLPPMCCLSSCNFLFPGDAHFLSTE